MRGHEGKFRFELPSVIPGQPAGLSPESITTIRSMDSGLALRAPRNDGPYVSTSPVLDPLAAESFRPCGSAR